MITERFEQKQEAILGCMVCSMGTVHKYHHQRPDGFSLRCMSLLFWFQSRAESVRGKWYTLKTVALQNDERSLKKTQTASIYFHRWIIFIFRKF